MNILMSHLYFNFNQKTRIAQAKTYAIVERFNISVINFANHFLFNMSRTDLFMFSAKFIKKNTRQLNLMNMDLDWNMKRH